LQTYEEIGMDDSYSECIRSFASVAAGGQITSGGSGNILETLLGGMSGGNQKPETGGAGAEIVQTLLNQFLTGGDYSSITGTTESGWLDIDRMKSSAAYYGDNRLDSAELLITEKNGQRVLALTEKQWDLVQQMEQNVWIDDGSGFIDLGLDNVYEYNDGGDLIMEYDGTWLALNGQIVSYFMLSDDRYGETYTIKGRVPAKLNDQLVDIMLVFDNENPDGRVLGAQIKYDAETQTEALPKGLIDIAAGDRIDFLCDYYTYDGQYTETYYLGEQYTATGEWTIENLSIKSSKYQMTYKLTDIYNNKYWTPSITN
ncbi:MAG TPA: peptidase C11, partial [Clostridiaceae bacterium]|nr:peptidase C11 [Clostridiaceae bacterium]